MKVLIVGLGKIGLQYDLYKTKFFLSHAKSFKNNKFFKSIGGIDKNKKKSKIFKNKYNGITFSKLDVALKEMQPDIVVISSNTNTHLKIIKELFLNGFRNKIIFCEKPCGNSLNEIKKILKLSKKFNTKIYVNYMRSSMPAFYKMKNLKFIDKSIFKGVCYYNQTILNECSHYINLFQLLFGKITKIKKSNKNYNLYKDSDFELFFRKGIIKFIHLKKLNYTTAKFEIFFKKFSICYNSDQNILKKYKITSNKIYDKKILNEKYSNSIKLDFQNVQKNIVKEIVKMIKNKKHSLVKIDEAVKTMKIIEELK